MSVSACPSFTSGTYLFEGKGLSAREKGSRRVREELKRVLSGLDAWSKSPSSQIIVPKLQNRENVRCEEAEHAPTVCDLDSRPFKLGRDRHLRIKIGTAHTFRLPVTVDARRHKMGKQCASHHT